MSTPDSLSSSAAQDREDAVARVRGSSMGRAPSASMAEAAGSSPVPGPDAQPARARPLDDSAAVDLEKARAEWERAYDDAMAWRDWQSCEILIEEREQAEWWLQRDREEDE